MESIKKFFAVAPRTRPTRLRRAEKRDNLRDNRLISRGNESRASVNREING